MAKYHLLNNVEHKDFKVITEYSEKYGDNLMFVMTFPFEFRNIQSVYPILLQKNSDDEFVPLALMGFAEDENLFLSDDGWDAPYVPAMVKRVPFLIGFQEKAGGEPQPVVTIDVESPKLSKEEGVDIFQPLGGNSEYLDEMTGLLDRIHMGHELNKEFVAALVEHDLLESVNMDITLNDGSNNQLLGFYTINEEKVQELSGEVLESFSKRGFLFPMFLVIASLSNIGELVRRKNKLIES